MVNMVTFFDWFFNTKKPIPYELGYAHDRNDAIPLAIGEEYEAV